MHGMGLVWGWEGAWCGVAIGRVHGVGLGGCVVWGWEGAWLGLDGLC